MSRDSVGGASPGTASGLAPVLDLDRCVCSGKTLARLLRPAILAILSQSPTHGYLLVQRLGDLDLAAGADPSGVYRTLKEMERERLVTSTWEAGDCGPAKRSYALTADGAACLVRWARTLQQYRAQIDGLLGLLASKRNPLPMLGQPKRGGRACACAAPALVEKGLRS